MKAQIDHVCMYMRKYMFTCVSWMREDLTFWDLTR